MKYISIICLATALAATGFSQNIKLGDNRLSPRLLNYQGYLTDTLGNPITNPSVSMIFAIFDAASAGNQKWTENQPSVAVDKGIFHVLLGSVTSIPDSVFTASATRYLQLTVAGQVLSPRTRIVAVPYAYTSTLSDTAAYARVSSPDNDWTRNGNKLYPYNLTDSVGIGTVTPRYALDVIGVICGGTADTASGFESFVGGGYSNLANGNRAAVVGGYDNAAAANYSFVGAGFNNSVTRQYGTISGGNMNSVSGDYSTVAGGARNSVSGGWSAIAGGFYNTAGGVRSFVGSGTGNSAGAEHSAVVTGNYNTAGGAYSTVINGINSVAAGRLSVVLSGDTCYNAGDYSAILGGFADTITATADYSYLFGINSNLTQDSTFLVDLPHIRFGKETGGYEFPTSDGSSGQVMITNGTGQLAWGNGNDNDWIRAGGKVYTYYSTDSIGLGTTAPKARLDIAASGVNTVAIKTRADVDLAAHSVDDLEFGFVDSMTGALVTRAMNIVSSGNVGIGTGTDAPLGKLDVANGSIWLSQLGATSNQGLIFGETTANVYGIMYDGAGTGVENKLLFNTTLGGGTIMALKGDGLVGIGTASPLCKLDVRGIICGGTSDTVKADFGAVLGGYGNLAGDAVDDTATVIAGGSWNVALAKFSFVGGGMLDTARGNYSAVVGGNNNTASGNYAFSGGGLNNIASNTYSVVGGGNTNTASAMAATVAGGQSNVASMNYATVGGGQQNTADSLHATVGGGFNNTARGRYSTVAGGWTNQATRQYTTVAGGFSHAATEYGATIGGGEDNDAAGRWSTVAGGVGNDVSQVASFVGGGFMNNASGFCSAVSGGQYNLASDWFATIPGGFNDTIAGYCGFGTNNHTMIYASDSNSAVFTTSHSITDNQVRAASYSTGTLVFTMDHPRDPLNKILNQYSVGSDGAMLMYTGDAVIGADGRVSVSLPDYFSEITRDPRIQLTGVGTYEIFVAEKINGNRFAIGGKPGTEVYWTVTAERTDVHAQIAYVKTPVEQEKTGDLRGHSLDDDALIGIYNGLQKEHPGEFVFRTEEGRQANERTKEPINK